MIFVMVFLVCSGNSSVGFVLVSLFRFFKLIWLVCCGMLLMKIFCSIVFVIGIVCLIMEVIVLLIVLIISSFFMLVVGMFLLMGMVIRVVLVVVSLSVFVVISWNIVVGLVLDNNLVVMLWVVLIYD